MFARRADAAAAGADACVVDVWPGLRRLLVGTNFRRLGKHIHRAAGRGRGRYGVRDEYRLCSDVEAGADWDLDTTRHAGRPCDAISSVNTLDRSGRFVPHFAGRRDRAGRSSAPASAASPRPV